jgi:hypothetical protein
MALSHQQKQRIIKLLNLSTSENDNEALSACRMAYSILKKHNLSWGDFLSVGNQQKNNQGGLSVEVMFDFLYDCDLSGKQKDFLNGLSRFYKSRKTLTDKQLESLTNMFFGNGGEDA